ncbi:MAG: hypothetical protein ACE5GQ_07130 [Nitrospinales bacterium]
MTRPFLFRRFFQAKVFFVCDIAGLFFFFNFVHWVRLGEWAGILSLPLACVSLLILLTLYVMDAYDSRSKTMNLGVNARAILAIVAGGGLMAALVYAGGLWGKIPLYSRFVLPVSLFLFACWAAGSRYCVLKWVDQSAEDLRWLVLGKRELVERFLKDFESTGQEGTLFFPPPAANDAAPVVAKREERPAQKAAAVNLTVRDNVGKVA